MAEQISLLRIAEVGRRCGLSRTTIYDRLTAGTFPKPVKLSERNVRWRSDEIAAWIEAVCAKRDAA